jgi:hypothetical protein
MITEAIHGMNNIKVRCLGIMAFYVTEKIRFSIVYFSHSNRHLEMTFTLNN